jgi:hypothetical protein
MTTWSGVDRPTPEIYAAVREGVVNVSDFDGTPSACVCVVSRSGATRDPSEPFGGREDGTLDL